ncbi:MAG: MBL fold metallo-hydrolase [Bacteroidales bacterium]|nr:MBL fold metallo-hydrolase [Bacteroidales bacterium]
MIIHKIIPGTFKLDGGATFGVVPKTLWSKAYPADENNLCIFALRLLLIETGDRKILIDTGIGNKQTEDFYKHYFREGHHSIEKALEEKGFSADSITDVLLTHLHFDHVGGAVKIDESGNSIPTFQNARYHVSRKQWEWAMEPNQREKASYLKENLLPLENSGLIDFIEYEGEYFSGISIRFFSGHTDGLIVPFIHYQDKTLVYTNDLLALSAHIPASWVCGFDTRPLISFEERNGLLQEAFRNNYYLVFQHDHYTECCTLKNTEKGIRKDKEFKLEELL